jgi:hypothetical protein
MLLNLAFLFFWPVLQGSPQYTELSKLWNNTEIIETGLTRPMATVTCPSRDSTSAGWLVAADSSGKMMELRFDGERWSTVRTFPVGVPLTSICSGAPYPDMDFRLYVGTKSGQILELSRGTLGWSRREIVQLPGPIKTIIASEAGAGGVISVLFAIDASGKLTQLVPPAGNKDQPSAPSLGHWSTRAMPDIPGGISQVVAHAYGARLWVAAAGPKGIVYRYDRDSLGVWRGDPWATMTSGVKYLAPSADPSMRDIAVFYEGTDGLFRYLFKGSTDDKKARLPVADGITHIVGVGSQRRFNEFFAVSGDEFCMFEYDFEDKAWQKVPFGKIDLPVVDAMFGFGRNEPVASMYVTCANGKVYEFVRYTN